MNDRRCDSHADRTESDSDIDKGSRGIEEISKALDTIEVGLSCLTPENVTAPWLLFEGGALSERIGNKSRLCTYLLGGLKNSDVPQPLGMFQHTVADKPETRNMLDSINQAINLTEPVNLDRIFDKMWPDLEDAIKKMPAPKKHVVAERTEREMIAEILDIVRGTHYVSSPPVTNWDMSYLDPTIPGNFDRLRRVLTDVRSRRNSFACWNCGASGPTATNDGVTCNKCGQLSLTISKSEPPIESEST